MSLVFPYDKLPTLNPIWPLYGRLERSRPTIIVAIVGPRGTVVRKALVDTGADDTVFPDFVATRLGVDLSQAPIGAAAGVGPTATAILRYAELTLRISDGKEYREWQARIGFTATPLQRPLLGFAGFLQFFDATFHGDREFLELTVNASYRGTCMTRRIRKW